MRRLVYLFSVALTWLLWAVGVGLMLLLAFAVQLLLHGVGRRALHTTA